MTDSVHNPPSAEQVRAIFNQLTKPKLKWTINALNLLRKIESDEDGIRVTVALITDDREEQEAFWEEAEVAIKRLGIKKARVVLERVNVASEGVAGIDKIIWWVRPKVASASPILP